MKMVVVMSMLVAGAAALAQPVLVPGRPVIRADFPDPFLLEADGEFLAFATNARGGPNVQMATSPDLRRWRRLSHDALPNLPDWATPGFTWAPEVLSVQVDGKTVYRLYFTARHTRSGLQCTGVASAASARGPFVPEGGEPLLCQWADGGTIDASPFRAPDGRLTLLFKNDGNHVGKRTDIFAQPLSADGLGLEGTAVPLLTNDAGWEGHVVEAPTMMHRPEGYYLFFSANDFGWPRGAAASPYAIGAALCETPLGPCRDLPANPLLESSRAAGVCRSGPGHQSLLQRGTETLLAYHAWETGPDCTPASPRRFFHIGRVQFPESATAPEHHRRPAPPAAGPQGDNRAGGG